MTLPNAERDVRTSRDSDEQRAQKAWRAGLAAVERVRPKIRDVEVLSKDVLANVSVEAIRDLRGSDRYYVLELLKIVDVPPSALLIDALVPIANSPKHAKQVRTVLGQLSHADLERLLPPAVARMLPDGDFYELVNYGYLLKHFGLRAALRDLIRFASTSNDAEIRSIGPEWFPEEQVILRDAD